MRKLKAKKSSVASVVAVFISLLVAHAGIAATVDTGTVTHSKSKSHKVNETPRARKRLKTLAHNRSQSAHLTTASSHRRHRYHERFTASSFMDDVTEGDASAGEDPIVRQAAIDALGNMNGTLVAVEPTSGRILAMVNQKLALSSGAQPCSTIKLSVALAALSEDLITKDTEIPLGRRTRMNLTEALAHSNNSYFEALDGSSVSKKSATTLINTDWANSRVTTFPVSSPVLIPTK